MYYKYMVLGKKHKHDDGTEHSHANGDIYHEHGKSSCECGEARSITCPEHGDKNVTKP